MNEIHIGDIIYHKIFPWGEGKVLHIKNNEYKIRWKGCADRPFEAWHHIIDLELTPTPTPKSTR